MTLNDFHVPYRALSNHYQNFLKGLFQIPSSLSFRQIQTGGFCLLLDELSRNHFLKMDSYHETSAKPKWFQYFHRTAFREHLLSSNRFSKTGVRVLLTIPTLRHWRETKIYATSAFRKTGPAQSDVFVRPPK